MKFSRWLNSLTTIDHIVILVFFIISGALARITLVGLIRWYNHVQKDNPYATSIRITPFPFLGIAILYTIIIYNLFGPYVTAWITSLR